MANKINENEWCISSDQHIKLKLAIKLWSVNRIKRFCTMAIKPTGFYLKCVVATDWIEIILSSYSATVWK